MPALLLLFPAPAAGAGVCARAHLAALPAANLFQRPQLAGQPIAARRRELSNGGQRLGRVCRLGQGASAGRGVLPRSTQAAIWTGWPASACRRCWNVSAAATTGASCRWSIPWTWCGAVRRRCRPVYEEISRQAIFTVKAPDVAKFLGKRFPAHRRRRWAATFTRASKARGSNTFWDRPRSSFTTSAGGCCAWNARSTT